MESTTNDGLSSRLSKKLLSEPSRRDSPDMDIPGDYPDTPTGPSITRRSAIPVRSKASPEDNHKGHDHRPTMKVDLPLHEQPSGSREGVGSLPGPNNARGVAILPDERHHKDDVKDTDHRGHDHRPIMKVDLPLHEQPSGAREGVGSLPGPNNARGVAILPDERLHKVEADAQSGDHRGHDHRPTMKVDLPTHEQPSGAREGVGSLPGPNDAVGVAILPDERHYAPQKRSPGKAGEHKNELPSTEITSGSAVGVGSLPGNIREAGVATLPEERVDGKPFGQYHTGFEDSLDTDWKNRHLKNRDNAANENRNELPSTEVPSGSRVGVGSLPGDNWEAGVATLPEERVDGKPYGQYHTGFEDSLDTDWKNRHARNRAVSSDQKTEKIDTQSKVETTQTSAHPTADVIAATTKQAGETARNIAVQAEHVAGDVVNAVGGAASGMYHGAGAMLDSIGVHLPGTEQVSSRPPLDLENRTRDTVSRTHGSFLTSGRDAPSSQQAGRPQSQIIINPSNDGAPNPIYHEQHRPEYDIHGERLDMDQFIYDDDASTTSGDIALAHVMLRRRNQADERINKAPSPSSGASGVQMPGQATAVGLGSVEYHTEGKDGVLPGYPTPQGMGVLVADRINNDHLRAQAALDDNVQSTRTQLLRGESTVSTQAERGSDPATPFIDEFAEDPLYTEHQIIEEKREVPVFINGESTATGKFEATFEPVPDQSAYGGPSQGQQDADVFERTLPPGQAKLEEAQDVPVFRDESDTAEAQYDAIFEPTRMWREQAQSRTMGAAQGAALDADTDTAKTAKFAASKSLSEMRGSPSYLGKPVSKEEEKIQVEKARRLVQKKAGIN